jgi:hypothetical protein
MRAGCSYRQRFAAAAAGSASWSSSALAVRRSFVCLRLAVVTIADFLGAGWQASLAGGGAVTAGSAFSFPACLVTTAGPGQRHRLLLPGRPLVAVGAGDDAGHLQRSSRFQ